MIIDLRTAKQKQLDAAHNKVAARYTYYRERAPQASDHQIFCRLSEEYGLSRAHIRKICIRKGVATPKRTKE